MCDDTVTAVHGSTMISFTHRGIGEGDIDPSNRVPSLTEPHDKGKYIVAYCNFDILLFQFSKVTVFAVFGAVD